MADIWQRNWDYPTEEQINTQIVKAKQAINEDLYKLKDIKFDKETKLITLYLYQQTIISFPYTLIKELKEGSTEQLSKVWFDEDSIYWEELDFDIHTKDFILYILNANGNFN
jgi:hypothetical protein